MPVSQTIGEAWIDIRARTDKFLSSSDIKASQDAGKTLAEGMATAFAAVKIFQFGTAAFRDWEEAQRLIKQTEAVLTSTGQAAGITQQHIEELTEAQMKKQVVDDEFVRRGANVLLTFTNIRNAVGQGNDVFDRASRLAVDYAKATGGDAASAAHTFGIALQDPEQGMTRLVRAGIRLSEQQQQTVKDFVASGDIMSAQKIILDELEKRYSGSAEAQATSADKARVAWGELKEEIGGKLAPAVMQGAELATGLIDAWNELPPVGQNIVLITGSVAVGLYGISRAFQAAQEVSQSFAAIKALLVGATTAEVAATNAATEAHVGNTIATETEAAAHRQLAKSETEAAVASGAASSSLLAMHPILVAVGVAAAALSAGYLILKARKDEVEEATKRVSAALQDEQGNLVQTKSAVETYLLSSGKFKDVVDDLNEIGVSTDVLKEQVMGGARGFRDFTEMVVAAADQGKLTRGEIEKLVETFRNEQAGLEATARAGLEKQRANKQLTDSEIAQFEAMKAGNTTLGSYSRLWDTVSARVVTAKTGITDLTIATDDLTTATDMASNPMYVLAHNMTQAASAADRLREAHRAMASQLGTNLGDISASYYGAEGALEDFNAKFKETSTASGGAARDVEKDARDMEAAIADVTKAEDDLADAIERQQLVAAGPDANRVKIAEIDARRAKRELADATDAAADAQEALNDAQKDTTPEKVARAKEAADRAVAAADREVERATIAVKEAQDRLTEAQASGDPTKIRDAELDLADAQDRVFEATGDAAKAHDDLKTAQELGEDAAKKVEKAQRQVEAANDDTTTAADELKAKEKELLDARTSHLAGSPEMEQAAKDVKDAQNNLRDAQQRVKDLEAEVATSRTSGASATGFQTAWEKTKNLISASDELVTQITEKGIPSMEDQQGALETVRLRMEAVAKTMSPEEADKLRKWYADWRAETEKTWAKIDVLGEHIGANGKTFDETWQNIERELADFGRRVDQGDFNATVTYTAEFDSSKLEAQMTNVLGDLEKFANQDFNGNGVIGRQLGGIGQGWAWVGEKGPELVHFGSPSAVIDNYNSREMMKDLNPASMMFNITIGQVSGSHGDAYRVGRQIALSAYRHLANPSLGLAARKGVGR